MITSTDKGTEMDGHLSEGNMFNGLSAVDRNRCMSCCVVIDKEPMNSGGNSKKEVTDQHLVETDKTDTSSCQTNLSNPDIAENKPKLISKAQILCVRNGSVECNNKDTEIHSISEFEESDKDGVFWKLSEFHRRSGKQGLETRFKLLAPTVIVSCSGENDGPDFDRSVENDTLSQNEDTKDVRCLRKRQPVDYFPKDGIKRASSETPSDDSTEKPLTVLNWYKDERRFRENGVHHIILKNGTSIQCVQTESSPKLAKFVRSNGMDLWQTKTVLLSLPDKSGNDANNLSPDRVTVTAYIKGDIKETESSMNYGIKGIESQINAYINKLQSCSDESKEMTTAESYLVDALNCSFRFDSVKDFEIDSLLHELDIHPVGLPESDQELKCHENSDHMNLGSEAPIDVPEIETTNSNTALSTPKEYIAEPIFLENKVSSYQAHFLDYVKGHVEHAENDSESMFSSSANEDEEFEMIKKQVECVRNGLSSPFLDLQLGNKTQNNELPDDCMENTTDKVHEISDIEKARKTDHTDVSSPDRKDGSEDCIENTIDKIHEISDFEQVSNTDHADDSSPDKKYGSEVDIENTTDKTHEISDFEQDSNTAPVDESDPDNKDGSEEQNMHLSTVKHDLVNRKIKGSKIFNRLKRDKIGNGQNFKEISEAIAIQYLSDDMPQTYFQSISEKVKFEQRRKRTASDDVRKETIACSLTLQDKENEDSEQHFNKQSPVSVCTAILTAMQTEPLNLSIRSDYNYDMTMHSTPLKKKRLSFANAPMKLSSKNSSDRFKRNIIKRQKRTLMPKSNAVVMNSNENDKCPELTMDEQTSMQSEPLDLSVHKLIRPTGKGTSVQQERCLTVNKRVLRNRAAVEYFPEKKKKRDNINRKSLRQKNDIKVDHSPSRPVEGVHSANMNSNSRECNENNGDCNSSRNYFHFDPMELSPEPLDLRVRTKANNLMDLEMERQIDGLCHGLHKEVSGREGDSEIRAVQNFSIEMDVTDTDENNNTLKDSCGINECYPDEQEKAVNVHTVLVGLYAAKNSKDGKPKQLLSGSEVFINGMGANELDEVRNDDKEERNVSCSQNEDIISHKTDIVKNNLTEDIELYLGMARDTEEKSKGMTKITELGNKSTDLSSSSDICAVGNTLKQVSVENEMEISTNENSIENEVDDNNNVQEVSEQLVLKANSDIVAIQKAPEQVSVTTCSQSEEQVDNNSDSAAELNGVASKASKDNPDSLNLTPENDTLHELPFSSLLNTQNKNSKEMDTVKGDLASEPPAVEGPSTIKQGFPVGTVVWGKFSKSRWWPAVVIHGKMLKRETRQGYQWIFWLSDNRVSQLKEHHVELFTSQYKARTAGKLKESMKIGILKALKICAERAGMDLQSFQSVEEWGQADSGFIKHAEDTVNRDLFPIDEACPLPLYILEQLGILTRSHFKDMNRVAVPDDNGVTRVADLDTPEDSDGKANKPSKKFYGIKTDPGKAVIVCLSCDLPLTEEYQMYNHLLFEGFMCGKCKEFMMSSFYATDDDDCSLYCGICGEGGKQFVCEKELCGRAFCHSCIERLSGKELVKQIQHTDPWYCFLCTDYDIATHGNIVPRKDWQLEVVQFFQTDTIPLCNDLHYLTSEKKRKIRVLSLYDGIGTGKQVLNELGLDVEVYYASEINPEAKLVTTCHHAVNHVGNAWQLSRERLKEMCPIDLVLAGPPCNDLSIVNPLRKGFNGTGILLVKFISILKDLEKLCENNHVFWLLENTGSMVIEYKDIICSLLGMEPAVWDAIHFTGQRRARNFWGNIPGLYSTPEYCKQLQKDKTDLGAALHTNCNRQARIPHLRTVTTGKNSLTIKNGEEALPIMMDGKEDGIWVSELERLFGFPDHYTDVGHLTPATRHRLLGKAWCVPVIKHILSPLRQYFALKET